MADRSLTALSLICAACASPTVAQPLLEDFKTDYGDVTTGTYAYLVDADNGGVVIAKYPSNGDASKIEVRNAETGIFLGDFYASYYVSFYSDIKLKGSTLAVGRDNDYVGPSNASGSVSLYDLGSFFVPPYNTLGYFEHPNPYTLDSFGASVEFNDEVVCVGAPGDRANGSFAGAAFVFDRDTQSLLYRLEAETPAEDERFGVDMAFWGDVLLVNMSNPDEISLFDLQTGQLMDVIRPPAGARFRYEITVDGDTLLVAGNDVNPNGEVFVYDLPTRSLVTRIEPPPCTGDICKNFGWDMKMDGDVAVISTSNNGGSGQSDGTAYLYDTRNWQLITQLAPSDFTPTVGEHERYGVSATIDGDRVVVASSGRRYPVHYLASGYAYFYSVPTVCIADTNGDGNLDPSDFTAWIDAFNNSLPACDQNGDGSCTPADFTAWIDNFNAGCD